ncbi:MAG: sigma-70 family RNA polymerase sigma factor [Acidobacteria bacterium]|nr:sigma-70 family RNA polymerase sigma factor [Acidobacteriota bacterium]
MAQSELVAEVARLRQGDPEALGPLLARYQNRLYRYLLRLVRDRATAEDLFQQTWLRVVEKVHQYDALRSFEAWLFALAHNLAIDYLRRYRPESLDELQSPDEPRNVQFPSAGPDALARALEQERAGLVIEALDELPAVYRELLSLRFEEEMKLAEIAEVLDMPLSTVKTRLKRGLERLRERLANIAPREMGQ